MNKEVVIHLSEKYINIALLEDGLLMELIKEEVTGGFSVGDIFMGKVRKTMTGLNAAFVSIGHEKDAFLHYQDLGANYKSLQKLTDSLQKKKNIDFQTMRKGEPTAKDGKINTVLNPGQSIMVQIIKESISTKGPRLSSEISLTGRHVVMMPFGSKISVSQKIRSAEERKRLKAIVAEVLPPNFSVIIRTAARDKSEAEIRADIESLVKKWDDVMARTRGANVPSLLISEQSRAKTIFRDLLNDSFSNIWVDNPAIMQEVKEYIGQIYPDKERIVKQYKGTVPIFDNFDITRQIKGQFGKLVPFQRKSYMIIEHTEALHVIDINSGPRVRNAESQEAIALEVNLNAVPHIARQLRLRDMGGIIVIDFIDFRKGENKEKLLQAMKEAMAQDRARHTILPLTKFGLMQITRQRVRPLAKIESMEQCPTCRGTGEITPAILFDSEIEQQIEHFVTEQECRYIKVELHPYLAAFFTRGIISHRLKMMFKYRCYIKIVPNESMGFVNARYFDSSGSELCSHSLFDNEIDIDQYQEIDTSEL